MSNLDNYILLRTNESEIKEICHDVNRRGQHCKNKATWAYLYAEPDIEQCVPGLTLYFCDVCKAKWEADTFTRKELWSLIKRED